MRSEAWVCALNEARSAARVDHEGAVRIYDIVEDNRCPWIVMEPLPGRTLQQALNAAGPLPARQVTETGAFDVLHLNIGRVCTATSRPVHLCGHGRVVLPTSASVTIGELRTAFPAPRPVPPERLGRVRAGVRPVSLGATLFTAVEGWPPFDRGSLAATLTAILLDAPAPARRAGPLRPVIEGLLAKDPARRLSIGQARAAFRAIQREHGTATFRLAGSRGGCLL